MRTQIYILNHYELYTLPIKIYVLKDYF